MGTSFNHRYSALHQVTHVDELFSCVCEIVSDLGFDDFFYLNWFAASSQYNDGEAFIWSSYPSDLMAQYQSGRCYELDPIVSYIREEQLPTTWGSQNFKGFRTEPMYWKDSSQGVCSGAAFPVPSSADTVIVFGYSSKQPYEQTRSALVSSMPYGQLLALHVHQAIKKFQKIHNKRTEINITHREKSCLLLAAQGQRDCEIAGELGIATRTVIFHINNARQKLKADTRTHAIARAISLNLISI
ncbi:MAG: autoinducer binding domain-containing protein [Betaproteobacteria bacterium]